MDYSAYDHQVTALARQPLDPRYTRALACEHAGVLGHLWAANAWGLDVIGPAPTRPWLTVPRESRRQPCTCCQPHLVRSDLKPQDRVDLYGAAVTSPLRTVRDASRQVPLPAAVALADSALRLNLITEQSLTVGVERLKGDRGSVQLRQVLDLVDPRCESCLESLVRVDLALGGVPKPETQVQLFGPDGERLLRADFVWREQRVLGEADGRASHQSREQFRWDRYVQNVLVGMGWLPLRWTWDDALLRPGRIAQQALDVLARR